MNNPPSSHGIEPTAAAAAAAAAHTHIYSIWGIDNTHNNRGIVDIRYGMYEAPIPNMTMCTATADRRMCSNYNHLPDKKLLVR